jgi:hypothetical protein
MDGEVVEDKDRRELTARFTCIPAIRPFADAV